MNLTSQRSLLVICVVTVLMASTAIGQLPFEQPPIDYSDSRPSDPVAIYQRGVKKGEAELRADAERGFLHSVLEDLKVPISSQTLVFSKTSLQRHLISPKRPRAIYFNDDTYVGYVPGGEVIEIASVDALLGTNFYTIQQPGQKRAGEIVRRTDRCLFCHASSDTGRVPGLMMQSVHTNSDGNRVFPSDALWPQPDGPLSVRWAGWFATGSVGNQQHLGNVMLDSDSSGREDPVAKEVTGEDLSGWFDTEQYPASHSDVVALLVLQHQVKTHNLLIDANHQARLLLHSASRRPQVSEAADGDGLSDEDRIALDTLAERVVDGILMVDRVRLTDRVLGSSSFAEEFMQRGPFDSEGRSLRRLDLRETLFHFPCSYLIGSDSFRRLPEPLMRGVGSRLFNVLQGKDVRSKYQHLTPIKREAILQILRETQPELERNGMTIE